MSKNILISTGGSGGHISPAKVFYEHLKENYNVFLSSDVRGSKFIKKNDFKLIILDTPKLSKNILLLFFQMFSIFSLIIKSLFVLKKKKIDILISTGGYMSFPLCIAAKFLGIKILLFEPNMVIGRSNKLFLSFCKYIFCYSKDLKNFPKKYENKILLISPLIRKVFYSYKSNIKKEVNKFRVMIVGGSQGAKIFDTHSQYSILDLSKKFNLKILHQTTKEKIVQLSNFYNENKIDNYVFDYDDNFIDLIHNVDLCITRAGASTISELTFLGIPFLAIPLPTAKDNHQFENANFYEKKNCCWILNQKDFDSHRLKEILTEIIENKSDYFEKKNNLKNLNYQNHWNNINQKIIEIINEN